jgi:TRAP-type C4-dicarboxylate transport system permease small subunit
VINRISNLLCRFTEIVSMVLFSVLIISVFLAVSDRFLIHRGLFWTEELARFLFVWLGSLTAAIMVQRRGHFAVSFLTEKFLDEQGRQILDIVISVFMLALMVLLLVYGIIYAEFARYQMSPALRIGMCYVYYSVPTGAALMILFWTAHIIDGVLKLKGSDKLQEL